MEEVKSNMEIALEFIADHPEMSERLKDEEFQIFWERPEEVLQQYQATVDYLKESFQFTDEMINENCLDYLGDACRALSQT